MEEMSSSEWRQMELGEISGDGADSRFRCCCDSARLQLPQTLPSRWTKQKSIQGPTTTEESKKQKYRQGQQLFSYAAASAFVQEKARSFFQKDQMENTKYFKFGHFSCQGDRIYQWWLMEGSRGRMLQADSDNQDKGESDRSPQSQRQRWRR